MLQIGRTTILDFIICVLKKKAQTSVIRYSGLPQPTMSHEEIRAYSTNSGHCLFMLFILSRW